MTENYRTLIGKTWIAVAEVFGKEISKASLPLMINAVSDLNPNAVLDALNNWIKTSKLGRHPLPAEIREIVTQPLDKKSIAIELARKIDKAISRHGYNWEQGFFGADGIYWDDDKGNKFYSFKEAVISELGEIGWHVICARGGWLTLRNSSNEMDEGMFIAQMRDQIQASIQLSEQGVDVAKIDLPKKQNQLSTAGGDLVRIGKLKILEGG